MKVAALTVAALALVFSLCMGEPEYPMHWSEKLEDPELFFDDMIKLEQILSQYHGVEWLQFNSQKIVIRIPNDHWMVSGTDSACLSFGNLCLELLETWPKHKLYVLTAWLPSSRHPITYGWSKVLAGESTELEPLD